MRFLNWEKSCVIPAWIRCSIEKVAVVGFANLRTQFLLTALLCYLCVVLLFPFLLSSSCFLASFIVFTVTGQFTDDDAPPLPWSVESDEQIIVARTEGFSPLVALVLFCTLPLTSFTSVLSQL